MNVRMQKTLVNYIDGIDFALWNFYINGAISVDVADLEKLSKQEPLSQSRKIKFNNPKSKKYLEDISRTSSLSKSVIIRRCLFWLSQQKNYPKNFKE